MATITTYEDLELDYSYLEKLIRKQFFPDTFRNIFNSLIGTTLQEDFVSLIEANGVCKDHNLYFFWIHYYDQWHTYKTFADSDIHKAGTIFNRDLFALRDLFKKVGWQYGGSVNEEYLKEPDGAYFLESVTIKLNRQNSKTKQPTKITLESDQLLRQVFLFLEKSFENINEYPEPSVKNKGRFREEFIQSTKPLFSYLKENHFNGKSANSIYGFIGEFVAACGFTWEKEGNQSTPIEYIKNCYLKIP